MIHVPVGGLRKKRSPPAPGRVTGQRCIMEKVQATLTRVKGRRVRCVVRNKLPVLVVVASDGAQVAVGTVAPPDQRAHVEALALVWAGADA